MVEDVRPKAGLGTDISPVENSVRVSFDLGNGPVLESNIQGTSPMTHTSAMGLDPPKCSLVRSMMICPCHEALASLYYRYVSSH
jgi:hypothetical protein